MEINIMLTHEEKVDNDFGFSPFSRPKPGLAAKAVFLESLNQYTFQIRFE